jgi:hypothetical protein
MSSHVRYKISCISTSTVGEEFIAFLSDIKETLGSFNDIKDSYCYLKFEDLMGAFFEEILVIIWPGK